MVNYVQSIMLFMLAGICEIGGGYLIWLWLRKGYSFWHGAMGAIVLVLYGIIPTLQPVIMPQAKLPFGRIYAAYGAIFIVMALLWGWLIDKRQPDRFDVIGMMICLIGTAVIMYWPRTGSG